MNMIDTFKMAKSIDFEKLGAAIPGFILRKIREKFNATASIIATKLKEGEKRPGLLLYADDNGKFCGLWVTLDEQGYTQRKLMLQEVEGLARLDHGDSIFALIPEIMAEAGQTLPTMPAVENTIQPDKEPNLFIKDGNSAND